MNEFLRRPSVDPATNLLITAHLAKSLNHQLTMKAAIFLSSMSVCKAEQ